MGPLFQAIDIGRSKTSGAMAMAMASHDFPEALLRTLANQLVTAPAAEAAAAESCASWDALGITAARLGS